MKCTVINCTNCNSKKNKYVGFYRLPKEEMACKQLNQDVLENFFGVIREKGGMNDHPDRQQFKYRLRSHILGRNGGVLSDSANVSVDDTPDLDIIPHTLTGSVLKGFPETVEDVEWGDWDDNVQLEALENDGLENLAGYICHQLHKNVPNVKSVQRHER